jgi:hypothetical protein
MLLSNKFFKRLLVLKKNNRGQSGFLTIDALFALIVIAGAIPVIHNIYVNQQVANLTDIAASQLKELETAVGKYVKANWTTIVATANQTLAYEVDPDELKSQGFLRESFRNESPYAQDYYIGIIGSPSDQLTAVILGHGGRPGLGILTGSNLKLATETIPETAQKLGITGGYIPYQETPGATATNIEGVNGIWNLDLSGIAGLNAVPAGSGSLASVSFYVDGAVNNDYLHRRDIGIPELNRMHTTLDMDGNDIDNIKSITNMTGYFKTAGDELADDASGNAVNAFVAERGSIELRDGVVKAGDVYIDDMLIDDKSVPMSRGVYDVRILRPREQIPKPTCPTGSLPQIFVSSESAPVGEDMLIATTAGNRSGDVLNYNTIAVSVGDSWRVGLEVFIATTSSGAWYELANTNQGRLLAMVKCT